MDYAPIQASACPLFRNFHHGQILHLQQAVVRRKNRLCLGHLPQLVVEALNGVGGINQPPDLLRIFEVSTQIWPVVPPGGGNLGISQCSAEIPSASSRVYGLKVGHERFPILVGHIPGRIMDPVDDTVLDLRFREYGFNGGGEAGEIIRAGDVEILHAAIS